MGNRVLRRIRDDILLRRRMEYRKLLNNPSNMAGALP